MTVSAVMSPDFLEWWFSPWRYAGSESLPWCDDDLARRERYRDWCRQMQVAPDLPDVAPSPWQAVALLPEDELLHCADLFGGLFAARLHQRQELAQLLASQRRWCLSVAMTQPLQAWHVAPASPPQTVRQRGLQELAARLEQVFPGLWPRLRLLLPPAPQSQHAPFSAVARNVSTRDLRCWQMCLAQVRNG